MAEENHVQSPTSKVRNQVLLTIRDKITNKAGLIEPPKPKNSEDIFSRWEGLKQRYGGIGDIPSNILGDILDNWSELLAYTRWLEAVADIKFQTAKEYLSLKKKQLLLVKGGTNREIRAAEAENDPEYLELFNIFIEENTAFILIKGIREGYEQRYFSVSREISRRTQSIEGYNRTQNVRNYE